MTAGLPSIGFLNPAIYNIGTNPSYSACFDDITVGNNTNLDVTQWSAVPGYDLCTGWGSPSGGSLIMALTRPDGFQITPGRGAVANGAFGGPFTIPSQTFTLTDVGQTAFDWALVGAPNWLTVSSTKGNLAPGGPGVSVSVSLNGAANQMVPGVYTANLWFTNVSSGFAQLRQFTLRVGQEMVLDGGFAAFDFAYWNLTGDSSIYTNNYVDTADDIFGANFPSYPDPGDEYLAALGELYSLAYLSQPLPTQAAKDLGWLNQHPVQPNQFGRFCLHPFAIRRPRFGRYYHIAIWKHQSGVFLPRCRERRARTGPRPAGSRPGWVGGSLLDVTFRPFLSSAILIEPFSGRLEQFGRVGHGYRKYHFGQ